MKKLSTQVFYIHGFASSPESATLKLLRESFHSAIGLTYDHNNPRKSVDEMVKLLESYPDKDIIIVGSSLGGWYAEQLTGRIVAQFILYNPSTEPEVALSACSMDWRAAIRRRSVSLTVSAID